MKTDYQFTNRAQEIIEDASKLATTHSHATLTPLHFLASMANSDENSAYLKDAGTPQAGTILSNGGGVISNAQKYMTQQKDFYIAQDHLLLALLNDSSIQTILKECSIKEDILKKQIQTNRGSQRIDSKVADTSSKLEFLTKYAIDLTQQAREGKIDPVIGREEEIRRCIRVLARRGKCNPCLIGDPGVGKTSIVEGVSQRIIDNDVPNVLANCSLYSLNLGALKAGAKYQGDFEERIKGVLKEIEESEKMNILFIDEIHMLMGDGTSDAANLLKPMLARGSLHCIGATTINEYSKNIEKDGAFERRFQKVDVKEPSVRETVAILRGLQGKYEIHHGVRILDNALVAAAQLTSRYLTYRKLPDSAVDLIDETAANVAVTRDSRPEKIDTLERELQLLQVEIKALERDATTDSSTKDRLLAAKKKVADLNEELAPIRTKYEEETKCLVELNNLKKKLDELEIKAQDAERGRDTTAAADLRYFAIPDIKQQIARIQNDKEAMSKVLIQDTVSADQIAETAARLSGIPVSKLTQSENIKLVNMEKELSEQVVGQAEAAKAISDSIRLSRSGLANPNAPASFMFLSLSGSGKTELAKKLAGFLFSDEKAIVRIDCSELNDKWSASKLLGAAPGYVGYEEGGILTNAILRRPYSVVLFDEVEKASPEVLTILLQILDDGRVTSSQGKLVNCANCIFIMTSSLGAEAIHQSPRSKVDSATRHNVMESVKAHFRPEFLNRISSMVVFNRLSKKAIRKIIQIRIQEIIKRFEANDKHLELRLSDDTLDYLCEHGYSKDLGARPLNRLIQNEILNKLAVLVLKNQVRDKETVQVINASRGLEVVPNHESAMVEEDGDIRMDESDSDHSDLEEDI
ncbi:P-loop containing nucleoside triphosphate hydrolase protein [Nadsonia fulvescens var. elongata DSM 6958]|uniref:p-loop containing nucleoside triphosphate hydrolase protein n=1 Tax=Nadsonia fulvescens var. elongata DSM 6958 TaxID=857566 RepID=A0A1E3PUC6_9ASCO|nr:P-loop containing nucleoside triphosphate hydrolase protein [Nadsonia fulvescens var. elongata DSM 6958]